MIPTGRLRRVRHPILCLMLALGIPAGAQGRVWTDTFSRTWEGEFLRIDGTNAVFMVRGQEYPFPLANLNGADRTFINSAVAAASKPSSALTGAQPSAATKAVPTAPPAPIAASTLDFLGVTLQPGKTVEAEAKLPDAYAKANASFYKKATSLVKVAIAVPEGFNPSKPQRLLITSASSTGDGLSIKNMGTYTATAIGRGWVVMATDGEFGKPPGDNVSFRSNLTIPLMDMIAAKWPKAKETWSVAFAGFSGGAGYASYLATDVSAHGRHVTGMLLMNSAYSPLDWEHDKVVKFTPAKMHKVPIFVSGGDTDNTQKVPDIRKRFDLLKRAGYRQTRMETQPGGHSPSKEHIAQALEWFESLEKESKTP